MRHDPFEVRFWRGVQKTDSCWLWTKCGVGFRSIRYGKLYMDGRETLAHRASWVLHHGPIPAGMQVCHKCDNGLCVRPDHLFLGTQSDNMQDAVAKGRLRFPQQITGVSPARRLTDDDLAAIVNAVGSSEALAKQFAVDPSYIRRIKQNAGRPQRIISTDLIVKVLAAEGTGKDIAARFGISPSHVSRIRRGQARAADVRRIAESGQDDAA